MIYIVMGVSGCGKSSMGKRLASAISADFYDADDFHSKASIEKMSSGTPLNDDDRKPWLEGLAQNMVDWNKKGDAVLACSALKETYREMLSSTLPGEVRFVYLKGDKRLIARRISSRKQHFMSSSLLDSQFDTLEEPTDAIVANIAKSPKQVLQKILEEISA